MAVIYYPIDANVYSRTIENSQLVELNIGVLPNNIFFFTGSTLFTSSIDGILFSTGSTYQITSSYALTASVALNAQSAGGVDIIQMRMFI